MTTKTRTSARIRPTGDPVIDKAGKDMAKSGGAILLLALVRTLLMIAVPLMALGVVIQGFRYGWDTTVPLAFFTVAAVAMVKGLGLAMDAFGRKMKQAQEQYKALTGVQVGDPVEIDE